MDVAGTSGQNGERQFGQVMGTALLEPQRIHNKETYPMCTVLCAVGECVIE